MSFTRILMCIDDFRLMVGGTSFYAEGALDEELRLNGWFLAHGDLTDMEVVFAAANGEGERRFSVSDRHEWSEGVGHAHAGEFGFAKAHHCRFSVNIRLSGAGVDPARGRLRAVMDDGVTVERALGAPRRDREDERAFTPADAQLMARFESIGENCEFGLVQRRVGVERMSLLRFTGVHDTRALARAIRAEFAGLAEGDTIRAHINDGEWIIDVDGVRLDFHTGRMAATTTRDEIIRQERTRLQFLAARFIEDLAEPTRVYVYRALRGGERGGPDGLLGMDELYDALCAHGGDPRLLWVTEGDGDLPAGSVVRVRGGLYRGAVPRLSPHFNAFLFDAGMWVDFLREALPVVTGVPALA